jgi:Uma2 family endonuclease
MTLLDIRLLTVEEYHRMAEIGIFDEDERVELLAGQIVKMAAKGTAHSASVTRTEKLVNNRLGNRVLVRLQDPIRLNNNSDLTLLWLYQIHFTMKTIIQLLLKFI